MNLDKNVLIIRFIKSALSMTGTNMDMVIAVAIYVCAIPNVASLFSLKNIRVCRRREVPRVIQMFCYLHDQDVNKFFHLEYFHS